MGESPLLVSQRVQLAFAFCLLNNLIISINVTCKTNFFLFQINYIYSYFMSRIKILFLFKQVLIISFFVGDIFLLSPPLPLTRLLCPWLHYHHFTKLEVSLKC